MTRQQFVRNTLEAIKAQGELDETALPPALLFGAARTEGYPKMLADETASVFGSPQASTSRVTIDSVNVAQAISANRPATDSPSGSTAYLPASPAMSRSGTTQSARGSDSPAPLPPRSESVMSLNSTFSHRSLEATLQSVLKVCASTLKSGRAVKLTITHLTGYLHGRQSAPHLPDFDWLCLDAGPAGSGTVVNLAEPGDLPVRYLEPALAAPSQSSQYKLDR